MLKDQLSLAVNENAIDAIAIGSLNACPSRPPSVCRGGNGNTIGTWATCLPDVNVEGTVNVSYGMYNESSLAFHGYGYTPQVAQRSYASFSAPSPSINTHGQLYNVPELTNLDTPYYQQLVSPNNPNIASQTSIFRAKLPLNINFQGDGNRFGPQPGFFPTPGFSCRGSNYLGDSRGFKYLPQGFDRFESSALCFDWSKPGNREGRSVHFSSATAGPKSIGSLGLSANCSGTASQQKGSVYGYGSRLGSSYKSYPQSESNGISRYDDVSSSVYGTNGQTWPTLHEARQGGRCNDFSCSCNVALDTLGERNRGPRAFKPRSQLVSNGSVTDNHRTSSVPDAYNEAHNCLDFTTDYKEAKFYVIKSYSEDNVHKSIKYGVWASTPNGNKKLDAAYHEAKENHRTCPLFLLFSVNASAQFCGVAEMVGPVDFDRSVDYWQQDKWSGRFPVKWHIIKDVPNCQFRHIVLENNDNKPVTNSRDTQEVHLENGVEMLKIFKNHESQSSILDDFPFYEERQKVMQARKSRQQPNPARISPSGDPISVSSSGDLIKKMSELCGSCFSD